MTSSALENVRRLAEWSRRSNDAGAAAAHVLLPDSVGVLGAGMMGTSIAAAHLRHRLQVILCDINPEALARRRP